MIERREHTRYSMPRGTFAILRNELDQLHNHRRMSIGEIAMVLYKSNIQTMGQVVDMSLGGVAFESRIPPELATGNLELDLLMAEQKIYLHNIPFAAQPVDSGSSPQKNNPNPQRTVLRFKELDPTLENELRDLMAFSVT